MFARSSENHWSVPNIQSPDEFVKSVNTAMSTEYNSFIVSGIYRCSYDFSGFLSETKKDQTYRQYTYEFKLIFLNV